MSQEERDFLMRVLAACAAVAAVATVTAAVASLAFFRRKLRDLHPTPGALGALLGAGSATYLGCYLLEILPRWKLGEVDARFLYLLLPATMLVELVAAFAQVPRWLAWGLRIVVVAGAARLLLHGSVYVPDSAASEASEWTPEQSYQLLGGLAAALIVLWMALSYLTHRTADRFVPLALAGTCLGAGVTVMATGYAAGGEIGLPLGASLAGAGIVGLVLPGKGIGSGMVGVGVVGLFALLMMGRFFGGLSDLQAGILMAAPLLCWLPELPLVNRLWRWARGVVRVALVLAPVSFVTWQALEQAAEESKSSTNSDEPSMEDYQNFKP